MRSLVDDPAVQRLEWILDGLDGTPGWGADADDVFAPSFATVVSNERYVEITRVRAARYAPVRLVGVEVSGYTARARLLNRCDETDVLTCTVEARPPHRISRTWLTGLVPAELTPRLPADFTASDLPRPATAPGAAPPRMIVFSGVPGSGKSTLADDVGARLGIPVFANDWLLGALTPYGGRHLDDLLGAGAELLTTLAVRQLALGQSAILDHPAEEPATRDRWRSLARSAGAQFRVVVCTCADAAVHRARAEGRTREIPGWHDGGDWADISRRLDRFPAWPAGDPVLTVDTSRPYQEVLAAVLDHVGPGRPGDDRPVRRL